METVDVEWVGDPPLLDDTTRLRIAMGELPPESATVLRAAESQRQRTAPAKGVSIRTVDPEYFGTSRQYIWGPDVFVTAVAKEDVDKILGDPYSGHQFRLKGEAGIQVITPPSSITLVEEFEGATLRDIYR